MPLGARSTYAQIDGPFILNPERLHLMAGWKMHLEI